MRIRKALAGIVGIAQGIIGVSAFVFACVLYLDLSGIRTLLNSSGSGYFYLSAVLVLGFLSLISGLFLVWEWLEPL